MGLLTTFQAAVLTARKSKDKNAAFLAMISSEITNTAKSAKIKTADGFTYGRQATDDDADQILRTTTKSLENTLAGNDKSPPIPAGTPYHDQLTTQISLLKAFLPEKLDDETLKREIREAAYATDSEVSIKSIGPIMKQLNAKFPGQIDGASVKDHLTKGDC